MELKTIYVLRLYRVYEDDNRDIIFQRYNITDIGYFSDYNILKEKVDDKYKDLEIVMDKEDENSEDIYYEHLRVFEIELNVFCEL
jgi:hypothetical protein